jgi:hypothetical protein
MATKADLITELQILSDKLSERSRVVAGGVIAIWWATLAGDKAPQGLSMRALLGPAICAACSLLLDVMQYATGYLQNALALNHSERIQGNEFKFNKGSPFLKARTGLWIGKQVAAVLAVCWLIYILSRQLWT